MNNKIVCHSPSERCYGCDHYHGKADVCKYAPEMTDEKIKPVGKVARTFIGEQKARWYEKLPNGTYIYPESALSQAREEGRIEGLREAARLLDDNWYKTQADCIDAITRAAEGDK